MGRNIWIKKSKYDLVLVTAKSPQMFINSLAEASFGFQTLINSSVHGKVSNRTKKLNPNARPRLNPQIVCAIQGAQLILIFKMQLFIIIFLYIFYT